MDSTFQNLSQTLKQAFSKVENNSLLFYQTLFWVFYGFFFVLPLLRDHSASAFPIAITLFCSHLVLFYLNLHKLIPHIYLKSRKLNYGLILLLLIFFVSFFDLAVVRYGLQQTHGFSDRPLHFHPRGPENDFFLAATAFHHAPFFLSSVIVALMSSLLGLIKYGTNNHVDNQTSHFIEDNPMIVLHSDHKIYRFRLGELLYIEGLKEYVSYYTCRGERIVVLQSMKELENKFRDFGFIRVHRSFIINVEKVTCVERGALYLGEKSVPIGKTYKDQTISVLSS